jgi:hypothetical protein
MQISRAFTIGFTNQWFTATANLTTGAPIQLSSQGVLPSLSPTPSSTTYYVNINTTNLIYLYDTAAHAIAGGSTGLYSVTALGSGQPLLSVISNVTAIVASSNLEITSNSYLATQAAVTFTTTGILPAPLVINTLYTIGSNTDGTISVYSFSTGLQITLTTIGSGQHDLDISSLGGIVLPANLRVPMNEYTTGDAVTLVPQGVASILPSPLVYGTTYYVRQVDLNTVQLYPTYAQAIAVGSLTGVIVPTNAGTGTFVIVKPTPMPTVAKITAVRKPLTNGTITLAAWDYKRCVDGPTIIGQYDPTEIEPKYRRIRIGCKNAPIRVAYKRRSFKILSMNDFIPVSSQLGLLTMCKAVDFLKRDFLELYQKNKVEAKTILEEQQSSQEAGGAINMQFESEIFTDGQGTWMDTGWGVGGCQW